MTDYATLASESVFRGRVLGLRQDRVRMSDGSEAVREVVEHPGSVAIVALDDTADDGTGGTVLLVNQYRHPIGRRLAELPAGLLDHEGESPLVAAQRELVEEAHTRADDWAVLVDLYTSPGMSEEAMRIFLARGLHEIPLEERPPLEHEELTMTLHRVPLAEAVRRAYAGDLQNGPAITGVLAAARALEDPSLLRPADAPWTLRTSER